MFDVILLCLCYPMSFPQFTISGISELIQVLCMILKMNISATFVVAYIQVQECFIYYSPVAGIWTETKKMFLGGSFFKLADDDV